MTLIAVFPCSEGFAVCADSQETGFDFDDTANDFVPVRKTVQKIIPHKAGFYEIAICGGGNGPLIDAFIILAKKAVDAESQAECSPDNPASVNRIRAALESELKNFYENDVRLCPATDKSIKLFIAACCPIAQQYAFWVSENIRLREARKDGPELNGDSYTLYEETASRLFSKNMSMGQAALAGIYTLTLAKNTSNFVRDPLSLAVIDASGIHLEQESYVKALSERLDEYEASINRIFLSCADATISTPDMEDALDKFKEAALRLHREQIDRQAASMNVFELMKSYPQRKLPKNTVIHYMADDTIRVEHSREAIEESHRQREKMKFLDGRPFKLLMRCGCGNAFKVAVPDWSSLAFSNSNSFACDKCGAMNRVTGVAPDDVSYD